MRPDCDSKVVIPSEIDQFTRSATRLAGVYREWSAQEMVEITSHLFTILVVPQDADPLPSDVFSPRLVLPEINYKNYGKRAP